MAHAGQGLPSRIEVTMTIRVDGRHRRLGLAPSGGGALHPLHHYLATRSIAVSSGLIGARDIGTCAPEPGTAS